MKKEEETTEKKQQQQRDVEFRRRKPVDYGRRTIKIKTEMETTDNKSSSGTNPNGKSSSLHKQSQLHRAGGGSRARSPRPGFETATYDKLFKTYRKNPNLLPQRSVNEKKLVNWRLACFMSNEYLTRGTLLGRPWPPQGSNNTQNPDDKSKPKSGCLDQDADERRSEKDRLYRTLTDFLRAGDVHLRRPTPARISRKSPPLQVSGGIIRFWIDIVDRRYGVCVPKPGRESDIAEKIQRGL